MTSYELEKVNIPSSTSCHRHQEDLFQSVSKPVLPVLTALLIFEGPITTSNLCKLMGASSDHLGPLIRWLNDNRWIEIEETGMDRLI